MSLWSLCDPQCYEEKAQLKERKITTQNTIGQGKKKKDLRKRKVKSSGLMAR